jgi:hypothetical protein
LRTNIIPAFLSKRAGPKKMNKCFFLPAFLSYLIPSTPLPKGIKLSDGVVKFSGQ